MHDNNWLCVPLSLTILIIIITYRYHSGLTGADPVCGGGGRQRGVGRGGGGNVTFLLLYEVWGSPKRAPKGSP